MPIVTITISIDAKETPAQRRVRISETQNGRKTRTRAIPDKRRKAPKHKKPLTVAAFAAKSQGMGQVQPIVVHRNGNTDLFGRFGRRR